MGNDFKILENLLKHTTKRHGVLLSNVANADTPGYKAKDMKFGNVLNNMTLEFKITHHKHIKGDGPEASGEIVSEPEESWLDSNNVEPDVEMAKLVENSMLFEAGINMLSAKIRMFKNALRRQL